MNFQNKNLINGVLNYRKVVQSKDIEIYSSAARELRHYMIENDPHYPTYHFTGPESWINDPNGPIYHEGKYHLFYQYDPIVEGKRSARCWGHAVSDDLVHWVDWPVAIWPDSPYDKNGVYSGNTVIDDQGIATALYTGNVNGHKESYGILARSYDGLLSWKKKMVMDKPPYPGTPVHWDAQVWKDGDTWYQLVGGTKDGKGAALLWTSKDLEDWTYQKPIYTGDPGEFWELPYLLPFEDKYVLMVGRSNNPYWIGTYNKKNMEFKPDHQQPFYVDRGTYYCVNPHMVDNKGKGGFERRILHGWVLGPPIPTDKVPYWQGSHSLPRVITVENNRLIQKPIPELKILRKEHYHLNNLKIDPETSDYLPTIKGDSLEIVVTFDSSNAKIGEFGIKLRMSEDGKDFSRVFYNKSTGEFGIDGQFISERLKESMPGWKGGTSWREYSSIKKNRLVTMHIFLDRSIIEVFMNGNVLTGRTFPRSDMVGVDIYSKGDKFYIKSFDLWKINSIWNKY